MESKSLRDYAVGNIEALAGLLAGEKMTNKKRREMANYMASIAANAFRLGYQEALSEEISEEEFRVKHQHKEGKMTSIGTSLAEIILQVQKAGK